ncbi:MAG: hypothetical protein IKC63_05285 [Clostridia bacterium]|nr:hypothetical protein [Clostridia bacterium]
MKRIISIFMAVMMCIGVMGAFAVTSYADDGATLPKDEIESTLSVPAGSDYVFYAQTRTNRMDAAEKDVRIICVATESFVGSIENFVATFTFTDGTTPVTLKSVGLSTVFKEIKAYGTDGNVETFTAAEGTVIFGWVITEVPEAYADVAANAPAVAVSTEAGAAPDTVPGNDYKTPVLVMDDINVETDGIYKDVETDLNGKVGGIDHATSKATYILSGNYEGFYDMTISYTDMDGRRLAVVVNGVVYIAEVTEKTSDWNDVSYAKTMTITVKMKKGANVISFMRTDGYAPNLVDFDLNRNDSYTAGDSVAIDIENYDEINGAAIESCTHGTPKVGWIGTDRTITYSIEVPANGTYLVSVGYLFGDDGNRKFALTVDEDPTFPVRIVKSSSNDDETAALESAFYLELTAGIHTVTVGGYEGWAPNLMGMTFTLVSAE